METYLDIVISSDHVLNDTSGPVCIGGPCALDSKVHQARVLKQIVRDVRNVEPGYERSYHQLLKV